MTYGWLHINQQIHQMSQIILKASKYNPLVNIVSQHPLTEALIPKSRKARIEASVQTNVCKWKSKHRLHVTSKTQETKFMCIIKILDRALLAIRVASRKFVLHMKFITSCHPISSPVSKAVKRTSIYSNVC